MNRQLMVPIHPPDAATPRVAARPVVRPRFAPPRAAYIHVPFCRHRCGYCNFTLVTGRDDLTDRYLLALDKELSELGMPQEIDTLYFGGGTPSHLAPRMLERLCATVRSWFLLRDGHEFSVEANPLDVTPERLSVLAGAGTTRLSLGAQSFAAGKLKLLERDHCRHDVELAVERGQGKGFVVSLDLIFAAPGETLAEWRHDLDEALRLHPHHISVYGLTWDRGTSFWSRLKRGDLQACPEDDERAMYEIAIDTLCAAGYEHYEVSNFARPGFRCRHNEAYWTGRTYFAAGPGAARHIAGRRELNHRSTTTYIQRVLSGQSAVAESECLSPEDSARERLVFELRRREGVDPHAFHSETGCELPSLAGEHLARFLEAGWLEWRDGRLRLTRAGLLISDALWPAILG